MLSLIARVMSCIDFENGDLRMDELLNDFICTHYYRDSEALARILIHDYQAISNGRCAHVMMPEVRWPVEVLAPPSGVWLRTWWADGRDDKSILAEGFTNSEITHWQFNLEANNVHTE